MHPPKTSPVSWAGDGTPHSRYYGDTYRSVLPSLGSLGSLGSSQGSTKDLGLDQSREVFLKGAGLFEPHPAWTGKEHWSILETGFGLGLNFLSTWAHWLSLPAQLKPKRLTYVSIEQFPVLGDDLLQSAAPWPELSPFVELLRDQWFGLVPGFHRLRFEQGAITLLLCIGEVQNALDALEMRADTIFLDGFNPKVNPQMWSHKVLGRVAQFAQVNTRLATWCVAASVVKSLEIHGFECKKAKGLAPKRHRLEATYKKTESLSSSTLKTPRSPSVTATQPGRCAVIGAGIAGACVAYSMAKRGWQVSVFDCAPRPAQGASGVPLGIFSTQLSADDNPSAQLSRAGIRHTHQLLAETMPQSQGEHWRISGVLEMRDTLMNNNSTGKRDIDDQSPQTQFTLLSSNPVGEKNLGVGGEDFESTIRDPSGAKKRTADPSTFKIFQTTQGLDWCELKPSIRSLRVLDRAVNNVSNADTDAALDAFTNPPKGAYESPPSGARSANTPNLPNVWHKRSGWVDPTQWINELLKTSGIEFYGHTQITSIKQSKNTAQKITPLSKSNTDVLPPTWLLEGFKTEGSHSESLSQHFDHVILANALAANSLLEPLLSPSAMMVPLQSTYGQLTWGEVPSKVCKDLYSFPVNGEGSFITRTVNEPQSTGFAADKAKSNELTRSLTRWYAGATFERVPSKKVESARNVNDTGETYTNVSSDAQRNEFNLQKLKHLYPSAYQTLSPYFSLTQAGADGEPVSAPAHLNSWSQWRCNTTNRLPWAQNFSTHNTPSGTLNLSGLSVLTGLGSKGLALAPLCAELLATSLHLEPLPIERQLSKQLQKIDY